MHQILIVPGLRDHAESHWQTWLASQWPGAQTLPPLGRDNLDLTARLQDLDNAVASARHPVVLVAHSGGCVLVAHWARSSPHTPKIAGALLATPPTFDQPLPPPYPSLAALDAAGWLPVPRQRLPFPTSVAISRNDPLGGFAAVQKLASDWGAAWTDVGDVGHLNPASGYGPWPAGLALLHQLVSG
jgi:predicted alpha/beta hydrolase family esterase